MSLGLEHPRILHIRAAARERLGDLAGALLDLQRAHALAPEDPGIANGLAVGLMRFERWSEAADALKSAAIAAPEVLPTWLNLGAAEMGLGRMSRAEEAYRRALDLDPAAVPALAKLAVLALHRSDPATAKGLAERALAIAPADSEARRALVEALIDLGMPADAEQAARAWLATPGLGPNARTHAFGLLADSLEREGRYGEAFDAYALSKAAFAEGHRARFAALEATPLATTLAAVEAEFDALPAEAWRAPDRPAETQGAAAHVFLMGYMRSGTTLLEQALGRHPEVVTVEELETLANSGGAEIGMPGGLRRIAGWSAAELESARTAYWRSVRDAGIEPSGKVLIDKLPFNGIKLPLIARLFPEAKVVFALRDPRDVVLSCFQKRLAPNGFSYEMRTLEGAARLYAAYMSLVRTYRARLPVPILDHRHEALLADVERSVREVCAFINLDYRPEMIGFAEAARAGRVMSQSSRQLGEGLTTRGAGRWRRYASQLQPILPILAPWVEAYGYAKA